MFTLLKEFLLLLILVPPSMMLRIINRVFKSDTLLLRWNLLLLLHLKLLMNLLSEIEIEFRSIGRRFSLDLRISPCWSSSVTWHRRNIMNWLFLSLLRQWRFPCKVWCHGLLGLVSVSSDRLFSLIISHKHSYCGTSRVLSLRLCWTSHNITVWSCHFDLLSIRWTHIQRYLYDVLIMVMYVDWGNLLSLILLLHMLMLLLNLLLLHSLLLMTAIACGIYSRTLAHWLSLLAVWI